MLLLVGCEFLHSNISTANVSPLFQKLLQKAFESTKLLYTSYKLLNDNFCHSSWLSLWPCTVAWNDEIKQCASTLSGYTEVLKRYLPAHLSRDVEQSVKVRVRTRCRWLGHRHSSVIKANVEDLLKTSGNSMVLSVQYYQWVLVYTWPGYRG